jgi:uncharacterized membrane protein YfcA
MNITAVQYLIICPLVFLAGLIDAIAGGGGLVSLPAYMIAGLPVHNAIATNKMSSSMGTSIATWKYARAGYVRWKVAISAVVMAMVGSNMGAHLALLLSDRIFRIVMLVILPLTALYIMRGKAFRTDQEELPEGKMILVSILIALIIGVYDGFYGPGTGTFLILLLTAFAKLRLDEANGVTKVINLSTNISALVVFLLNGVVLLPLGIAAGGFNILGNYIGSTMFERGGVKFVKPAMLLVLCVFFIKTLIEMKN